jgi:hypothetical protein
LSYQGGKRLKIAILGWGSLIWDERPEFDERHDGWLPGGPFLKLEFSRISQTRANALTLVIDEQNGEKCQVSYALSKRGNLDDVVCDLRCREGTVLKHIGYCVIDDANRSGEPAIPGGVREWAKKKELDAVVWTGLPSNFQEQTGKNFSVSEALTHLKGLCPEGKAKAAEYVWRAPDFIDTPLRRALEVEPWFARPEGA